MKKISVVIPTCNRQHLLAKCLRALVRQDFAAEEFEVIVVIDGVDIGTEHMMRSMLQSKGPDISYLRIYEKRGPAAARNRGWLRAKGRLVAFTDDDCIPATDWLRKIWEAYEANPANEIAYSGKVIVPMPDVPTDHALNTANLETADFVTANCVCTKQALLKTGGFDEQFRMAWREDSDLEFKLIQGNIPVLRLQQAVVEHPVREATWGTSIKEQKKGMYNALLYKKFPDLYREKIGQKAPLTYYLMIFFFCCFLVAWIMQQHAILLVSLVCWLVLVGLFSYKRLMRTGMSGSNLTEIVFTSAVIPFASVYWQWYGAVKFRVLFL